MSALYREKFVGDFYHSDVIRQRTEIKRNLLESNKRIQDQITNLKTNLTQVRASGKSMRIGIINLLECTLLQVENLNLLTNNKYLYLYSINQRIEKELNVYFQKIENNKVRDLSLSLFETNPSHDILIGGKASKLSSLISILPQNIPHGFVITTAAYDLLMESNHLQRNIHSLLSNLDVVTNRELFQNRTSSIRQMIEKTNLPVEISDEIDKQLKRFPISGCNSWAVRSSCVGENINKTFGGQFDNFFNVLSKDLPQSYLKVIASRFLDKAIYYRMSRGIKEVETPMAVLFIPMIDARSGGVLYTRDPKDRSSDHMLINSIWSLA
ncbi:PEP/pyruvate-binding domain-containing protein, partial [bacterium]|nr:PEP/pyruvate-binding domain-containing protein [bacterium]